MNRKIVPIVLCLIFALTLSLSACGRQPTPKKTSAIMKHFFKKYAKKYPESIIGKYPVEDVNVLHVEEVHRGEIAVYAILNLKNDMPIQTRFTIVKKPLGWRASSWENMGMATGKPPE